MIKAKKSCLFSLLLFTVTMASVIVGRSSLIAANLGISTGNEDVKKQGKAKPAAC
ncbi:hypothetical protein MH138_01375 [Bacillus safensis]|uniref:hypothetical protein n=1 Tax=Bacillus TaxID=1386 RepID=UPI000AD025CF|nr:MULTISPECIES: hypothetical protein [Bacillus]MBW4854125.1 hypothetical protein [Bacillaceae bacterium]MBW4857842.1 hypothetical protein [Bacillaceae bacterium]MCY7582827.1 hypothetical protein [Bacillus safensis]MCY7586202.1 hypothetical protein [Bacillus safensis]MCY7610145.1 hypothetical protein [Bacillus safensis]